MLQTKIFRGWPDSLERQINSWLEDNPEIELITVTQSGQAGDNMVVISIFYKTEKK